MDRCSCLAHGMSDLSLSQLIAAAVLDLVNSAPNGYGNVRLPRAQDLHEYCHAWALEQVRMRAEQNMIMGLRIVVGRWLQTCSRRIERSWYIRAIVEKDGKNVEFVWARRQLFDQHVVSVLHELCMDNARAGLLITSVSIAEVTLPRVNPLDFSGLVGACDKLLGISPWKCAHAARNLHSLGFISSPLHTTRKFDPAFDARSAALRLAGAADWREYATRLLDGRGFASPPTECGSNSGHSPIHPLKLASPADVGDDWKVYELIARHFLACCSQDAHGNRYDIHGGIAGEQFETSALIVTSVGSWLDVYPYLTIGSAPLPYFQPCELCQFVLLDLVEARVCPSQLLYETNLYFAMERAGVSAGLHVCDIIEELRARGMVERNGLEIQPSQLGLTTIWNSDMDGRVRAQQA